MQLRAGLGKGGEVGARAACVVATLALGAACAAAIPPAAAAGDGAAQPAVERLAWLAGCWEGTLSNGATYEEAWLAPRGGEMIGMARMTRGAGTLSFEFMRIRQDEDGTLVYAAQPSGRPPTEFRTTSVGLTRVVFENAGHDFPQRILYTLAPPDELVARIEGEQGGQVRSMTFAMRRVGCPGST